MNVGVDILTVIKSTRADDHNAGARVIAAVYAAVAFRAGIQPRPRATRLGEAALCHFAFNREVRFQGQLL